MASFRTLELATKFCHRIEDLKYRGYLQDQLMRAASSVALNLSEGNARHYPKEKVRYFNIAYASLKETLTILTLARIKDEEILSMGDHLGALIYKQSRPIHTKSRFRGLGQSETAAAADFRLQVQTLQQNQVSDSESAAVADSEHEV